jgi:zinc transport system ATP-binding protein
MKPHTLLLAGTQLGYKNTSVAKIPTDLTIFPGTDILLYGDNGAGKTTLLRTLAHLEKPTEGQIPVLPLAKTITTEDFNLPEEMPARAGLKLLCPNGHEKAIAGAKTLGVEYNKPWRELSKGNKQRIRLLAATWAPDNTIPNLQLYDEPLSGLDSQTIQFFLQLWTDLRKTDGYQTIRIFSMHGSHIRSMNWDQIWKVAPEIPGGISYVRTEPVQNDAFHSANQTETVDLAKKPQAIAGEINPDL